MKKIRILLLPNRVLNRRVERLDQEVNKDARELGIDN